MGQVWINRALRFGAVALTLTLLAALPPARPAGAGPSKSGVDPAATYKSLAQAAEAGAVDPELVPLLQAGKPVDLFAVLDGRAVLDAYGDGERPRGGEPQRPDRRPGDRRPLGQRGLQRRPGRGRRSK